MMNNASVIPILLCHLLRSYSFIVTPSPFLWSPVIGSLAAGDLILKSQLVFLFPAKYHDV
jgi:hypothetical protein